MTDNRERYDVTMKSADGSVDIQQRGIVEEEARKLVESQKNKGDDVFREIVRDILQGGSFGFMGMSRDRNDVTVSSYMPRIAGTEKQTCPSRMNQVGPWKREENLDTWDMVGDDKVCNFCGGMHPERFIEILDEFGLDILDHSDKRYKIHIHRPGVTNAGHGGIKYYRWHDTPGVAEKLMELEKEPA